MTSWMHDSAHYTTKLAMYSRTDASRHDRDATYIHDLLCADAMDVDYKVRVRNTPVERFNESYMFVPNYTHDNRFPNTCCDCMVQVPHDRILRDPGKAISIPFNVWAQKQRALASRTDTGFCASMLLLWSCGDKETIKSAYLKTLKPCHIVVLDGGAVGPIWCVRVALTTPPKRRSHLPPLHLGVAALGGDPNATENIWGHSHFDAQRNGFLRVGYSLLWPLHPDDAHMQAAQFSEDRLTTSLLDENRKPRDWREVNPSGGPEGMIDAFFTNVAAHYPRATPCLRVDRLFATLVCRPSPPYARCVCTGSTHLALATKPGEVGLQLQPTVHADDSSDAQCSKHTRSSKVIKCATLQSLPDDIMLSIVETALADDPRRSGALRTSHDGVGKNRVVHLLRLRAVSSQLCRVVHAIVRKQMEGLFELCDWLRETDCHLPMHFEQTCRLARQWLHGQAAPWISHRSLSTIVIVEHMTRLHGAAIAHHRRHNTASYCTMLRLLFLELHFECRPVCGVQRTRLAAQAHLPYMGPRTRRARANSAVVTLRMHCPVHFVGGCVIARGKDASLASEDESVPSQAADDDLASRTAALHDSTDFVYKFPCDASTRHPSIHVDRWIALEDPLGRKAIL